MASGAGTVDSEGTGAEGEGKAGASGSESSKGFCLTGRQPRHKDVTRPRHENHRNWDGSLSFLHLFSPFLKAGHLWYKSHIALHIKSAHPDCLALVPRAVELCSWLAVRLKPPAEYLKWGS